MIPLTHTTRIGANGCSVRTAWRRSIACAMSVFGREVAIKVLPPDVSADRDRLARFETVNDPLSVSFRAHGRFLAWKGLHSACANVSCCTAEEWPVLGCDRPALY